LKGLIDQAGFFSAIEEGEIISVKQRGAILRYEALEGGHQK
jgi:hypothetical protein